MHEVRSNGAHLPTSMYMNSFQNNVAEVIPFYVEVSGELARKIPEETWAISTLNWLFYSVVSRLVHGK